MFILASGEANERKSTGEVIIEPGAKRPASPFKCLCVCVCVLSLRYVCVSKLCIKHKTSVSLGRVWAATFPTFVPLPVRCASLPNRYLVPSAYRGVETSMIYRFLSSELAWWCFFTEACLISKLPTPHAAGLISGSTTRLKTHTAFQERKIHHSELLFLGGTGRKTIFNITYASANFSARVCVCFPPVLRQLKVNKSDKRKHH